MNRIANAHMRLAQAADLADVLDAAYDAFDDMLAVLRCHQEDEECAFPAFVLAAGAAANGRDSIGGAPSLLPASACERRGDLLEGASFADVALAVASLGGELATKLIAFAVIAANPEDCACCEHAAGEGATIRTLLGAVSSP
jgi:hypothetical protein